MDSAGALHLLFRIGETIDGEKLLRLTHSFNDSGEVIWLATFTDHTETIIVTAIP